MLFPSGSPTASQEVTDELVQTWQDRVTAFTGAEMEDQGVSGSPARIRGDGTRRVISIRCVCWRTS